MDNPFKSPSIISVCPGILGLERGLERAIGPVRVAAYVEIETFICANIIAAMEQGAIRPAPVWSDLKTFPAGQFHGKIHGLTGGYPCQPFSHAGNRAGADDPRHLWPFIREIARLTDASWCFFENVPGHLSLGYREVRQDLESLGYSVEEGLYSAEEAGAPHKRDRLFILAIKLAYTESIEGRLLLQPGQPAGRSAESSRAGETVEMAHANDGRRQQFNPGERPVQIADEDSQAMDNADGHRYEPQHGVPTGWHGVESAGQTVADAQSLGVQRHRTEGQQITETRTGSKLSACHGGGVLDRWPAGQGYYQHGWEEPRTAQPFLGSAANGYNYREDFLRALGNSVVEQTAEIAFLDLLNKHLDAI